MDEGQRDELLSRLTLEEKTALLAGADRWHTAAIERPLGEVDRIPALKVSDGPNGVRGADANRSPSSACFPVGVALGATWNPRLVERVGAALAQEARDKGAHILLAPTVNIHRSPLAGRNFECYSEDPLLSGRIAASYIRGLQQNGVGACIKHLVANDSEYQRFTISSEVGERPLREIYLAPFRIAMREAGPWAVMSAYNRLNGTYCSENTRLLLEILKGEWGFDGIVISDWYGTYSPGVAEGGLDLEMPGPGRFLGERTLQQVRAGALDEAVVDDKVRRLLRTMDRVGAFDEARGPERAVDRPEHRSLAREAARESMVLLKNEAPAGREHPLLPLAVEEIKTIAVIGENALRAQIQGGGSAHVNPHYAVSPLQGIRRRAGDAVEVRYALGTPIEVVYSPSPELHERSLRLGCLEPLPEAPLAQAVAAAGEADVVVLVAGLSDEWESEGFDRADMTLPGAQAELIAAVAQANPNTVVVLNAGAAVDMPWLAEVPALLQMWYTGQEAGNALADVLFGEADPGGRLPTTFPKRLRDNPAYVNYPGENGRVQYGEGLFVGYRYYDHKGIEPLFPFGHGLSYTEFAYRTLDLDPETAGPGDVIQAEVTLENVGRRAGQEVVQLYLRDVKATLVRPPKELKQFAKVALQPGETRTVTLSLTRDDLAYYDPVQRCWVAEAGEFEVLVGRSAADIRLRSRFYWRGEGPAAFSRWRSQSLRALLDGPQTREVLQVLLPDLLEQPRLDTLAGLNLDELARMVPHLLSPERLEAVYEALEASGDA